jgi:secreted trypsin-like serine protease
MAVARVGCSGVLIAPDVVLTAAHCLDPYIVDMVGVPGFVLADDAGDGSTRVAGARAIVHEGYESRFVFHTYLESPDDVGLLVLASPITGTAPAVIAGPADAPALGLAVEVAGYGQRTVGDDMTLGREQSAEASVTEIGETEIRFTAPGTPAPCVAEGDSGGPVFADVAGAPRVLGVTSHAGAEMFCGGMGDIAERVDAYAGWITTNAPAVCEVSRHACPMPDAGPGDAGPPMGAGGGCSIGGRSAPPAGSLVLLALVVLRSLSRAEDLRLGRRARR